MKFITTQPDTPYFTWQVLVQVYNFRKLGMEDDLVIVFGYNKTPSREAVFIKENTSATCLMVEDTRRIKTYSPSIQPFLLHQVAPQLSTRTWFLLDSDVIFLRPPKFHRLIDSDVSFLSDTRSYLGYQYLISKGEQQFRDMCAIVGIEPSTVERFDGRAGGAQLLLHDMRDTEKVQRLFSKVEIDSVNLYHYMSSREKEWKGEGHPIQKWTAGMWALLWNLWIHDFQTEISAEMDFCWASDADNRRDCSMLHVAGVTKEMSATHFYKGDYQTTHPFVIPPVGGHPTNMSHVYRDLVLQARDFWIAQGWTP